MYDRDLEQVASELAARRRRGRDAALLSVPALAGAALSAMVSSALTLALAAGGLVQILIALAAFVGRRQLIERLALDPRAYVLPEVESYGTTVARRRERLASWLTEVVTDAPRGNTLYLGDRVSDYGGELLALARDLGAPGAAVRPASAVACQRLLTHAIESPLYNPRLPADELPSTLARIRAGIDADYS